jgi:hypothetical protein
LGASKVRLIRFKLRFARERIEHYASRYAYDNEGTTEIEIAVASVVRQNQTYTKNQFLKVCYWKSPRTQKWCASNDARTVKLISRAALTSSDERVRIETLTTLRGVSWPTASVLLHFGHTDPYPILDYRALWSLGVDSAPLYTFGVWWSYVQFCRALAKQSGVSIRTLDKALWQYSKAHQL